MIGKVSIDDQIRETHVGFRLITDYEAYINGIDQDFESEDAIFNGYIYKLNTPQFNLVKRSRYGKGCNLKEQIFDYRGKNCYIPCNGYCFINCINHLTNSDYKEQN